MPALRESGWLPVSQYGALLGRIVEVVYRDRRLNLHASGVLHRDSGEFIFIEQHFDPNGGGRVFSFVLKIPYNCIIGLNESNAASTSRIG
jgi:hypothetical protein